MKIRHKITLWIAGTALLSTIIFSVFIVFELTEIPLSLIDQELQHMADAILQASKVSPDNNITINSMNLPHTPDNYWIKITDKSRKILYQSRITQYTNMPPSGEKTRYNIERNIPKKLIYLGQDSDNNVAFHVRVITATIGLQPVIIKIAKPIENIEEEYLDLFQYYIVSLLFCTIFISTISYKLAGKILSPVAFMSSMTQQIGEESLDKRIPLNGSRDEFYELSQALNKMFDRLQSSFEKQKEFLSNASHELKTPITLLKLAQEDLLINYDLTAPMKTNLNRQIKTTTRMSKLVRNLLDLATLEQTETITKIPVNIKGLLNQVLEEFHEVITARKITIKHHLSEELIVYGDPENLLRLMVNLISNSIRYNLTSEGIIQIYGKELNGVLLLNICNTGQMIPEEDLSRIFEQFYRVEKSRAMAHGGTGLGLTIAKKIITLHGGDISVTNEADGLIQVAVSLPVL